MQNYFAAPRGASPTASSSCCAVGGEARDQPGAEQRHRLVAEILGMGRQIIAVALVEPDVERAHQPAGLDVFGKQDRIDQRQPVAHHRVLHGELLRCRTRGRGRRRDRAGRSSRAIISQNMWRGRSSSLRCSRSQEEMNLAGSVWSTALQQLRAAQDGRAHHPQEIVDRVGDARLGDRRWRCRCRRPSPARSSASTRSRRRCRDSRRGNRAGSESRADRRKWSAARPSAPASAGPSP